MTFSTVQLIKKLDMRLLVSVKYRKLKPKVFKLMCLINFQSTGYISLCFIALVFAEGDKNYLKKVEKFLDLIVNLNIIQLHYNGTIFRRAQVMEHLI